MGQRIITFIGGPSDGERLCVQYLPYEYILPVMEQLSLNGVSGGTDVSLDIAIPFRDAVYRRVGFDEDEDEEQWYQFSHIRR